MISSIVEEDEEETGTGVFIAVVKPCGPVIDSKALSRLKHDQPQGISLSHDI
jgi:hypothetical protein